MSSVSVIIVNWNSSELLLRCLAALERQTYPIAETIVIDNASTRPPLPEMGERFPGLRVIRLEHNTGFAAANNHAIHHCGQSEWIALLNPDAFPEPDWLEQLIRASVAFPDHAFFGSRMLMDHDPQVLDGTGDSYHVSGLVWRQNHGCPATDTSGKHTEIFSPCAAAALYRRDAFLSVGGFDEDYFCYIEDVDLGFRLRLANHRCLYVPDAMVHHVGSASTARQSDFYVYHGQRNLVWTYVKDMPAPLFWIYLPQHLLLNLIALLRFSVRGQAKTIFRAKWDALLGLPRILQKRRVVQTTRIVDAWQLRKMLETGWPAKHQCKS